jgi:hypothetical protein
MLGRWMGADSVESSVKISSVSFLWTSCVHSDGSAMGTEQADQSTLPCDVTTDVCRDKRIGRFEAVVVRWRA